MFPSITHIGSTLMVVACTACASAALTKLCNVPESIETVLYYICSIFTGNSNSHNFKRFSPNIQAPYETHVFLFTYHCISMFSIVPALVFLTWLLWYQCLWRCLAVAVLWSTRWVLSPTILFFVYNFATKPAFSNKILLVLLVLRCIAPTGLC